MSSLNIVATDKVIHYKRAQFKNSDASLHQMLEAALTKTTKAKDRMEVLDRSGNIVCLINHFKKFHGMLCGHAIVFTKGKDQQVVTLDDGVEEFDLESIKSPEKEGKTTEFLESMLYFGIMDNHVIILQSTSFKARQLERHLGWLLGTRTGLLPQNSALILMDKPAESIYDRVSKAPVKTINVGSPLTAEIPANTTQTQEVKSLCYRPIGRAGSILQQVLGDSWFDSLNLDEALDEANLKVNLQITYLRKTTQTGQAVLDNIASAMRHMEDEDVSIDLKGGGTIKGQDLKLSTKIKVDCKGGIPIENDLYNNMHTWLISLTSSSEIDGAMNDD